MKRKIQFITSSVVDFDDGVELGESLEILKGGVIVDVDDNGDESVVLTVNVPPKVVEPPEAPVVKCAECEESFRSKYCEGCVLKNKLLPCYPPSRLCLERRKVLAEQPVESSGSDKAPVCTFTKTRGHQPPEADSRKLLALIEIAKSGVFRDQPKMQLALDDAVRKELAGEGEDGTRQGSLCWRVASAQGSA